ncbi:MAG: hypothetical protein M1608_07185 [Candidatus Omnitrophica bacterium]|nr:hypothetical protein [Candidatus Omnitrophota bacterium]
MAPAPPTFGWDPAMDYRKFEDSWIRGADGKAQKCWDGYNCNPSPRFSLAQAEFQRLTNWVRKYHLDGIFLDFYADTNFILRPRVALDRYIKLDKDQHYQVLLWSLTGEPVALVAGLGEEMDRRVFEPALAPGEVKVMTFVKDATATKLLAAGKE